MSATDRGEVLEHALAAWNAIPAGGVVKELGVHCGIDTRTPLQVVRIRHSSALGVLRIT